MLPACAATPGGPTGGTNPSPVATPAMPAPSQSPSFARYAASATPYAGVNLLITAPAPSSRGDCFAISRIFILQIYLF